MKTANRLRFSSDTTPAFVRHANRDPKISRGTNDGARIGTPQSAAHWRTEYQTPPRYAVALQSLAIDGAHRRSANLARPSPAPHDRQAARESPRPARAGKSRASPPHPSPRLRARWPLLPTRLGPA